MADDEDLVLEEPSSGGRKKWLIIIIAVVVLAGGGVAAWLLMSGDDAQTESEAKQEQKAEVVQAQQAMYVGMPRPFVFNVPGASRDRLVQIKVQLMVRGGENEALAKQHTPLLEGTLLKVFSGATAENLESLEGKDELRKNSLVQVRKAMTKLTGAPVVEQVLFTGFVMQ